MEKNLGVFALAWIVASFCLLSACGDNDGSVTQPESSSSRVKSSSSSVTLATPCKSETADDCEYGSFTDVRDGQEYKTVKIGSQTWMAENLNYKTASSFCYYDDEEYCNKYGRLYLWKATVDVCPDGWHLPTENEFRTLIETVGGDSIAGRVLKSASGWDSADRNGTDAFGFTALPAGERDYVGNFFSEGGFANFWGSTEAGPEQAANMRISHSYESAYIYASGKDYAFSVRCIKNDE